MAFEWSEKAYKIVKQTFFWLCQENLKYIYTGDPNIAQPKSSRQCAKEQSLTELNVAEFKNTIGQTPINRMPKI